MNTEGFVFILLLLFPAMPVLVARLANFAGNYRLFMMVILLILVCSTIPYLFISSAYQSLIIIPAGLLTNLFLVLPIAMGGRWLARFVTRRYMPSVAEALSSVIVGGLTSVATIIVGSYTIPYFLPKEQITNLSAPQTVPIEFIIPVMGIMITTTASVAWILLGWGSMPVLRSRKGTTLGFISIGMSVIFSVLLTFTLTPVAGLFVNEHQDVNNITVYLLILGAASMLVGMISGGFMHGILSGFASLFDLASFFLMIGLLYVVFSGNFYNQQPSLYIGNPIQHLVMIIAMATIHLRVIIMDNRVVALFSSVLLTVPFVGMIAWLPNGSSLIALIGLFIVFLLSINHWGVALRKSPHAGLVSSILLIIGLITSPLILLL